MRLAEGNIPARKAAALGLTVAREGASRSVEVVVGGADDLVDLREHGGHVLRRRRCGGQEAQLAVALLLVRAVGDQALVWLLNAKGAGLTSIAAAGGADEIAVLAGYGGFVARERHGRRGQHLMRTWDDARLHCMTLLGDLTTLNEVAPVL